MEWLSQIKPPFGTPLALNHWANQGLVASYLMNEFGGDKIFDSTLNGNTGTLTGMTPFSATSGWVPGPYGAALAFDGSNDRLNMGNLTMALARQEVTFSIWCKRNSSATLMTPWYFNAADNANYYPYDVNGKIYTNEFMTLRSSFVHGLDLTQWHNVAITRKAGANNFNYYIDAKNLFSVDGGIWQLDTTAYIKFNGLISSVSIYNRALSAEEIAYLYAFPWCMYEAEEMPAWMMDGGAIPAGSHRIPSIPKIPNIPNVGWLSAA